MADILIVDDDPHSTVLLRKVLTHEQHRVRIATDGLEALRLIEESPPDLLILDIMMPVMDGFAVTRRLRADERFKQLPIIVVSAKGQTRDITTGLDAGANDYLTKPIILDELLARIRTALRLKQAQDELTQANAELKRLNELKGRMVYTVSHELRTPITSIRSALELVVKRAGASLPSNCIGLLDICIRNTDRLIRLINDVLEFSRLESGHESLRKTPFNVKELLERAVSEVVALGESDQIVLQVSVEPELELGYGDPERIHQVALNLLSNAIKFSNPGGRIDLTGRRGQRGGLEISVRDYGRGIDREDLERIFEPFLHVGRPNRGLGGSSGLGLAISREIVERHGGTISAQSSLENGTTFTLTLPSPTQRL